jgi:hypothetical protein
MKRNAAIPAARPKTLIAVKILFLRRLLHAVLV